MSRSRQLHLRHRRHDHTRAAPAKTYVYEGSTAFEERCLHQYLTYSNMNNDSSNNVKNTVSIHPQHHPNQSLNLNLSTHSSITPDIVAGLSPQNGVSPQSGSSSGDHADGEILPLQPEQQRIDTVSASELRRSPSPSPPPPPNTTERRLQIPEGPVFYPTLQDFETNPITYIESIRPIAEQYGICKIVPPPGWNPTPFGIDLNDHLHSSSSDSTNNDNNNPDNHRHIQRFQTKLQDLTRLQEGVHFGDGCEYTAHEYQVVASRRAMDWKAHKYPHHDLLWRHYRHHQTQQQQQQQNNQNGDSDSKLNSAAGTSTSIFTTAAALDKLYTAENLERDFWNIVENERRRTGTAGQIIVEYGNDVDTGEFGSGFPLSERGRSFNGTADPCKLNLPEPRFGTEDFYKETWWNLNNIPGAPNSVLRHVNVPINGINVPWMYFGSLFTTFCWHNEDNYMYSINYHHRGAPKVWYGVPGDTQSADGVEKVFKSYLSFKMRDSPDLLHHITTMFSPRMLQNADIPVYRILQYEGEYMVTFPRSFHSGFSLGPNIGEAVNFATHDWIEHATAANERYRSCARPAVFSQDRLTFTMANHLDEQKSLATCTRLLEAVERVVAEELSGRRALIELGVRDMLDEGTLPKNRVDQLDEKSADYDEKRLCYKCKHVCFFSAVACECSLCSVSCLRHSESMCSCSPAQRYMMIWSSDSELNCTVENVRRRCEELSADGKYEPDGPTFEKTSEAPGAALDRHLNDGYDIPIDSVNKLSLSKPLPCSSVKRDTASLRYNYITKTFKESSVTQSDRKRLISEMTVDNLGQELNKEDEEENDLVRGCKSYIRVYPVPNDQKKEKFNAVEEVKTEFPFLSTFEDPV